jgi:hypothetical protein
MLCSFFYGFPRLSVHPSTHPNNFTSDTVDVVICFVWFMQINFDPFPTASPTTLYFMVIFTMYILYFCLVSKRKSQHELKHKSHYPHVWPRKREDKIYNVKILLGATAPYWPWKLTWLFISWCTKDCIFVSYQLFQ